MATSLGTSFHGAQLSHVARRIQRPLQPRLRPLGGSGVSALLRKADGPGRASLGGGAKRPMLRPLAPAPCGRERAEGRDAASHVVRAGDDSDVPSFKGFPPMQGRPAWYWRIFAVVPYFLPLFEGWLYSESAITVYAPLFHYKVLCSPIVNLFAILPSWFLLAYFFSAYLGVVRNNRWPHFLRFHVVMGMLMEIILQVIGTLNDWIPPSALWGRFGSHFWLGATVAYVFIILECVISALKGMYADVPFVSDAAYLQIPYE